jgi:hypothetical protein
VLYGDADVALLPAGADGFTGRVLALKGGWPSFQTEILTPPELPALPTADDVARHQRLAALHAHFSGQELEIEAPRIVPTVKRAAAKKSSGC